MPDAAGASGAPGGTESARDEDWTIARVLGWATDDFRRRGLDSPRLDAELLLCHVLGVDRLRLIVDSGRTLTKTELLAYRELIVRRRRAEPVAYILGVREFHGHALRVGPSVLVPRPDTETLVDVALDRTRSAHLFGEALDLCTGSGCVAIAFARRRPTWRVTGVDVSPDAVATARINVERVGATFSTSIALGDLDAPLEASARFDLITANPPYIPTGELATLPADVRDHEPHLALDGGADGLDIVRRVVDVARRRLRPGGVLALEIGHDQASRTAALLADKGFVAVERRKDYGGIERVVSGLSNGGS
ncbi:MAG TPA: peptide chain release factor N(5)-glutamine methyltransferase [Polyangiaceae bacterium]|jgi:release factor glutamine methyltransferase|nr:peptide chain release factor N(5)-glutamine methyltransferase [Polyangiaceae bacterium]